LPNVPTLILFFFIFHTNKKYCIQLNTDKFYLIFKNYAGQILQNLNDFSALLNDPKIMEQLKTISDKLNNNSTPSNCTQNQNTTSIMQSMSGFLPTTNNQNALNQNIMTTLLNSIVGKNQKFDNMQNMMMLMGMISQIQNNSKNKEMKCSKCGSKYIESTHNNDQEV